MLKKDSPFFRLLSSITDKLRDQIALGLAPDDDWDGVEYVPHTDFGHALQRYLESRKFQDLEKNWRVPATMILLLPEPQLQDLYDKDLLDELPGVLTGQLEKYIEKREYQVKSGPFQVYLTASPDDELRFDARVKPGQAPPKWTPGTAPKPDPTPQAKPASVPQTDYGTVAAARKAPAEETQASVLYRQAPAELIIRAEGSTETVLLTVFPFTLGRATPEELADIQFSANDEVSRKHLRIDQTEKGSYTVEDLGSLNGTTLNGKPLELNQVTPLPNDSELVLAERVHIRFVETFGTRSVKK